MRGLIIGTGYSLRQQLDLIPRFDGLLFGPNNTYRDFPLDVWLACDPTWHNFYGKVEGDFDKWHWDEDVCTLYGYQHVTGVWHEGLWLKDKTKISLNHGSAPQLINLAANQYNLTEIVLVGHDFHYDAPQRHYFDAVSETPGEYPSPLRKFSKFIKTNGQDDLLAVYGRIAKSIEGTGIRIVNATPDSKLHHFPKVQLEEYCK